MVKCGGNSTHQLGVTQSWQQGSERDVQTLVPVSSPHIWPVAAWTGRGCWIMCWKGVQGAVWRSDVTSCPPLLLGSAFGNFPTSTPTARNIWRRVRKLENRQGLDSAALVFHSTHNAPVYCACVQVNARSTMNVSEARLSECTILSPSGQLITSQHSLWQQAVCPECGHSQQVNTFP